MARARPSSKPKDKSRTRRTASSRHKSKSSKRSHRVSHLPELDAMVAKIKHKISAAAETAKTAAAKVANTTSKVDDVKGVDENVARLGVEMDACSKQLSSTADAETKIKSSLARIAKIEQGAKHKAKGGGANVLSELAVSARGGGGK
eukprot:g694.t1